MAGLAKGLAGAAAVILVASLYFSATLDVEQRGIPEKRAAVRRAPEVSFDAISQAAAEVQALAAAVNAPSKSLPTSWEQEYRRAAEVLEGDIAAALAALERNPGCARAVNMVNANLQRQADTLRTLYIERSL